MTITLLTTFPDYFVGLINTSIIKRAIEKKLVDIKVIDLRNFTNDRHKTTDDRPFGGGAGMIMKIEPIDLALKSLQLSKGQENQKIILTSAKGEIFTQTSAQIWSSLNQLTIICGHYGGVDERVAKYLVDEEVRIGDYVLTGGEPAGSVMVDAVVRLLPAVLGNSQSLEEESHSRLKMGSAPVYTRPAIYNNWSVPAILLSGDDKKIKLWQKEQQSVLKD
jgi:tRNA (guanine37-N1)-methyltransferase